MYKRLVEIMLPATSSGLITIPTEADMAGPRRRRHRQVPPGRRGWAEERIALFRLAWDMSISAFGGRQSHYESFFFGYLLRMKQALYGIYDRRCLCRAGQARLCGRLRLAADGADVTDVHKLSRAAASVFAVAIDIGQLDAFVSTNLIDHLDQLGALLGFGGQQRSPPRESTRSHTRRPVHARCVAPLSDRTDFERRATQALHPT